jgi:hypothetical protein
MLAVYLNDMKTLYFIKDIRENEFYWRYRIDEGFTKEIKEATSFESEEEALKEFQQDYLEELFTNRLIEIVKVYSLNGL